MRKIKFRAWDKKGRFDMSNVWIIDFENKWLCVEDTWNEDRESRRGGMG